MDIVELRVWLEPHALIGVRPVREFNRRRLALRFAQTCAQPGGSPVERVNPREYVQKLAGKRESRLEGAVPFSTR